MELEIEYFLKALVQRKSLAIITSSARISGELASYHERSADVLWETRDEPNLGASKIITRRLTQNKITGISMVNSRPLF